MTTTLYLYFMSLIPIPFTTQDAMLDWQLHLMVHEAYIRERREQSCFLSGDILISLDPTHPYKPIPLRKKVKKPIIGRELT